MPTHVKKDGVWKQSNAIYVKKDGVWKTISRAYIKKDGVWQTIHNKIVAVTVSSNQTNFNLYTAAVAAGWDTSNKTTIVCTVNSGIIIDSSSAGTPAFTFGSINSTNTVTLINLGSIKGKAGGGGIGSGANSSFNPYRYLGTPAAGGAGSDALNITCDTTITNASGYIWGGGGGGGGGGAYVQDGGTNGGAGGSGGGGAGDDVGSGGAGSIEHYNGGSSVFTAAASNGTTTTGGAGAVGVSGTSTPGGTGGTGGTPGVAGSSGGTPSSYGASYSTGGAGGAAGKAIELNGNSVTWVSGSSDPRVKGAVS